MFVGIAAAWQAGPYKVLKTARVGGEGGWDYIYADAAGRRLYIPRGATRPVPATDGKPEVPAIQARLTVFNLDTLDPAGEIPGGMAQRLIQSPAMASPATIRKCRCSIPKRSP